MIPKLNIFSKVRLLTILSIILILIFNLSSFYFIYFTTLKNEEEKINIYMSTLASNFNNYTADKKNKIEDLHIEDYTGDLNNYRWKVIITDKNGMLLYDSSRIVENLTNEE